MSLPDQSREHIGRHTPSQSAGPAVGDVRTPFANGCEAGVSARRDSAAAGVGIRRRDVLAMFALWPQTLLPISPGPRGRPQAAHALAALPARQAAAPAAAGAFREVRRNVGVFTGPGGTIGWLAGRDGALLVDSQFPESAAACLTALRDRGVRTPVEVLINSHHHGDHTAGNRTLRPAVARIVQHERCAAAHRAMAAAAGTGALQAYADVTFADRWTVDVGDERVTAAHLGAAHTGGDAIVIFERANVVHLGDYVFRDIPPFVDRANGASLRSWVTGLERIATEFRDASFVFGHARGGAVGGVREVVRFRDYLSAVLEYVDRAMRAGRPRAEIVALRELPGFPEVGDLVKDYSSPIPLFTLAHVLGAAVDELGAVGPAGRP